MGVIGGVWVCTGWSIKVGGKVIEVVAGPDKTQGIVAAEATGVKKRWGAGDLRSRPNAGASSPYGTPYGTTPVSATFPQSAPPFGNYYGSMANSPILSAGYAPPSPYSVPPSPYFASTPATLNGFQPPSPNVPSRPSVPPSPTHSRNTSGARNLNGSGDPKKSD